MTILFVVANVANTVAVLKRWSDPGFADFLKSYDLRPAIRYLDERGIRHAYATYADAYRIAYATDERITCSQPFNERFLGWAVPFKESVDASTNVAYVLSDAYRFPPQAFARDMAAMGVACRTQECGRYQVFTDFTDTRPATNALALTTAWPSEGVIPQGLLMAGASHNAAEAGRMIDGSPAFWRSSGHLQQTGMWISVEWDTSRLARGVVVDHGSWGGDHSERLHIDHLSGNGQWERLPGAVGSRPEPFEFRNRHPIYGRTVAYVELSRPTETRGLRLEIAEARHGQAWTIDEIRVLTVVE